MIEFRKRDKSKELFKSAVRIGVSGHRIPPKLPDDSIPMLYKTMHQTLGYIGSEATAHIHSSDLIVVSSLAEGADTIIAQTGLQSGFRLEAILPFPRDEYALDFKSGQALANYQALLTQASLVLELAGNPLDRPFAYRAAGLAMLAKVDALVAIWDGKPANGVGGTTEIIEHAVKAQIPILWSNPSQPSELRIFLAGLGSPRTLHVGNFEKADRAKLALMVNRILERPARS